MSLVYSMEFKVLGVPVRLDVAIACFVLGFIICSLLLCQCTSLKEGLAPIDYKMGEGLPNSWENIKVGDHQQGQTNTAESILAGNVAPNPEQQLEQGELFMFGENKFSPMCCPSIYSGSDGCACMSSGQANFLNQRGGNRTMTTIY